MTSLPILKFKYKDICCNYDGSIYVVCTLNGKIFKNTECILDKSDAKFTSISCSKDLKYIHAIDSTSNLIYSSNDFGVSFKTDNIILYKTSKLSCSFDGKIIIIATQIQEPNYKIRVYYSNDYGYSFLYGDYYLGVPTQISMNYDGSIIYISSINAISKSTDYGITWTKISTDGPTNITCSGSGRIVYYIKKSLINKSVDFGNTWESIQISSNYDYKYITCCENGCKVFIATYYPDVYINTGYNNDFITTNLSFGPFIGKPTFISSICCNNDGSICYISNESGEIYQIKNN